MCRSWDSDPLDDLAVRHRHSSETRWWLATRMPAGVSIKPWFVSRLRTLINRRRDLQKPWFVRALRVMTFATARIRIPCNDRQFFLGEFYKLICRCICFSADGDVGTICFFSKYIMGKSAAQALQSETSLHPFIDLFFCHILLRTDLMAGVYR